MQISVKRFLGIFLAALMVTSAVSASAAYAPVTIEDVLEAAETADSLTMDWYGTMDGIFFEDGVDESAVPEGVKQSLIFYKAFREGNYLKHGANSVALQRGLFAFSDVEAALEDYNARALQVEAMEQRVHEEITHANVTLRVRKAEISEDSVCLDILEWTFYDYDDTSVDGVTTDAAGYGVEHKISLVKSGRYWLISEDEYEDSFLDTSLLKNIPMSSEEKGLRKAAPKATGNKPPAEPKYTYYSGYNVNAAVNYSNTWANGRNPNYADFSDLGGDCANFTSQCINAGGMPQVVCDAYGSSGWFYKTGSNRSATWTGAPYLYNWMKANRGPGMTASNGNVWKGCPCFVDWYGDGGIDHAYFCVGRNSAGTAIINSHTGYQYHQVWAYGGGVYYWTVQLTSREGGSPPPPPPKTVTAPKVSFSGGVQANPNYTIDYGKTLTVSWGKVTNATKYNYSAYSYNGEPSATASTKYTVTSSSTTGTSFSFAVPNKGKYMYVTVTAVGPSNSASAKDLLVLLGPSATYPTNVQYIPLSTTNDWFNGPENVSNSMLWTKAKGKAFAAKFWRAFLCTPNTDGTYTVGSIYEAGVDKSVTVTGTNVLFAIHSGYEKFEYAAEIKVGDKLTFVGVWLDLCGKRGQHHILVNGGKSLAVEAPVVTCPSEIELGSTASVSWAACSNAKSYNYKVTNGSAVVTEATGATEKSFTIPAVTSGTSLTVTVTAVGSVDSKTTTKTITLKVTAPADITSSNSDVVKVSNEKVFRGFSTNTSADSALDSFEQDRKFLEIRDRNGNVITANDYIATGCTVNVVYNGEVKVTYSLVVTCDINGDGSATMADYVAESKAIKGRVTLEGAFHVAADVDSDGIFGVGDLAKMRLSITG